MTGRGNPPAGRPERTRVLAELSGHVRRTLARALEGHDRVALVDVPTHTNVGDSAIWLGELAALTAIGVRVAYMSDIETFDAGRLRRAVRDGPILLHGGGNLGDLWPRHQLFREHVVSSFPERPVVQLPQSIEFGDPLAARRAAKVLDAHPRLTLLVRDGRSLDRAHRLFRTRSELCPDSAFCLPPRARAGPGRCPVLALLRQDHEAPDTHRGGWPTADVEPDCVVDWLEEPPSASVPRARALAARVRDGGVRARLSERGLRRAWKTAAEARLVRGLGILSRGQTVVTDRLHAHVLCLLAGIPHVVVPDRFGKVEAFLRTWTGGIPGVRSAPDPAAGWALAREMSASGAST